LREGYPAHLSRSGLVDWNALLGLMSAAAGQGRDPFTEAVRVQQRLFTTKPIFLGGQEALKHPETPCGLKTDSERARHMRKRVRQRLNSQGEWQLPPPPQPVPLREIKAGQASRLSSRSEDAVAETASPSKPDAALPDKTGEAPVLRSVMSEPSALEKVGHGTLCVLFEQDGQKIWGRSLTVADFLSPDRLLLAKWVRRLTNWSGRQVPLSLWQEKTAALVERKLKEQNTSVVRYERQGPKMLALVSLADLPMRVPVDAHGVALWRPREREVLPADCAR